MGTSTRRENEISDQTQTHTLSRMEQATRDMVDEVKRMIGGRE